MATSASVPFDTLVAVDLLGFPHFNLLDFSAFLTVAIWWALIICVTALGIALEGFGASRR